MTAPRRILPNQTYLLTRRCTQRQFLLRPDPELMCIFSYCLAEAAARYGIQLIAWLVMSNHYHAVVYDPHGRLPAFLEHLHKMLAKCINALRGRWENVWSTEETCVTLLPTPEDVFDKVVYILANPLAAYLVDRASDWPGLSSLKYLDGKVTEHKRPKWFFRKMGKVMPESVKLRAVRPPNEKGEALVEWAVRVREAVNMKERHYRETRLAKNIKLLGRKNVLSTSPATSPSKETLHRKLRPAVACKNEERREVEFAILKGFRVEYARKLRLYIDSKNQRARQKIAFPAGTYRLRMLGVRCAKFKPPLAA